MDFGFKVIVMKEAANHRDDFVFVLFKGNLFNVGKIQQKEILLGNAALLGVVLRQLHALGRVFVGDEKQLIRLQRPRVATAQRQQSRQQDRASYSKSNHR